MNIAIVTSEFPPEPTVAGRMADDLALDLAARGHRVKVICPFPSRPYGVLYPRPAGRGLQRELKDGVEIVRVPSLVAPRSRLFPRILESWSFGSWAARVLADAGGSPELVYSSAWPLLAQFLIGAKASKLAIPHVMHIMDVYPESALQKVPVWVQTLTRRMLLALDRRNALRSSRVVVISESMKDTYVATRGVPPARLEVIHTWQDEALFLRLPDRLEAARAYAVDAGRFTFLYLGNIGPVAGVEHLIRSFGRADLPHAQLLIVGDGSEKEGCVALAKDFPARILFLSDRDVNHVPRLQSLADVCLLPIKLGAAFHSIPSKLCSYMLSAKPVLASVDDGSETARLVRASDCGWIIQPEDIPALAAAMERLSRLDSAELLARGTRGRTYALEHLSKTSGLERLTSILTDTAARHAAPRPGRRG